MFDEKVSIDLNKLLNALKDETLNSVIDDLGGQNPEENGFGLEMFTIMAIAEWHDRHPGTIAPCIFWRTRERGGFPKVYDGPRQTIDFDTGAIIGEDDLKLIH